MSCEHCWQVDERLEAITDLVAEAIKAHLAGKHDDVLAILNDIDDILEEDDDDDC